MQIGSSNPYLATFASAATRSTSQRAAGVTEAASFAAALTAASQTAGPAGASTVTPTAQLSESDKTARQKLSHLTDGDRALVNAAFGLTLGPDGADAEGRSLAPVSVWIMAEDRASGRLPAGQPITAAYLNEMRKNASASGAAADLVGQYDRLLAALSAGPSWQPVDVRS